MPLGLAQRLGRTGEKAASRDGEGGEGILGRRRKALGRKALGMKKRLARGARDAMLSSCQPGASKP